jgi:hypothetical protein
MIKDELGDWLQPDLFRFGASSFWAISSGNWNTTSQAAILPAGVTRSIKAGFFGMHFLKLRTGRMTKSRDLQDNGLRPT